MKKRNRGDTETKVLHRGSKKTALFSVLPLCLCASAVSSAFAAAPRVTVRTEATVAGREIRLRDVSDATGAVGDTVLGAAPLPGRSCVLSAGEIRLRLRAAKADLARFILPPAVTVSASRGADAAGGIIAAATDALRRALPGPAEDVLLEPVSAPRLPALRAGQTAIVVAGAPVLRSARSAVVPVTVSVAGATAGEARTVEVAFRVRSFTRAVVAARSIARHAVIYPEDVALSRVEVGGAAFVGSVEAVVGRRAARAVPGGKSLNPADIEEAPVVAAQAAVTVRVVFGDVEVVARGVTCEEGRVGQTIRVRLAPDAKTPGPDRVVRARVADALNVIVGDEE